jgi:hypothetical protein
MGPSVLTRRRSRHADKRGVWMGNPSKPRYDIRHPETTTIFTTGHHAAPIHSSVEPRRSDRGGKMQDQGGRA